MLNLLVGVGVGGEEPLGLLECAARGVLFGNHQQAERFFTSYSNTDEQIGHAIEVAEEAFRAVAD